MATFKFGRYINIHWNGYDIQGPADTVFSIPDQLYEEFNGDIAPVEPTLQWIDTNEFQTLKDSVPTGGYVAKVIGTSPVSISSTSNTSTISISSGTSPNGYLIASDGTGGVIFTPASTSGLTSVVGVSPISAIVSGGTVSVSLDANYQTAGTYVNAVIGTSPASVVTASGTSTVSIDQAAITGATAATNAQTVRTYVKNTTGTTIAAGKAVYVSGATGDNALISLATASTEVGSSKTLGITAESIATDAFGYVVESGYLTGIDTTGVTAGSSVWLGNTPGSLVFGAPPAEPSHSVYLGVVIREQQNNGSILVKVQNGYELDELHDVSAASPTDLDILQYKSSSALWTKASISNAGIAASTHTHDYQASGTYVNAVIGTSPVTVSTASGTSTVSIVSSSINSTHLADNAVVAAKINAGAVDTSKISSGLAALNTVLTANGTGGASFLPVSSSSASVSISEFTASGTWTKPTGTIAAYVMLVGAGGGGASRGSGSGIANGGSGGVCVTRMFRSSDISSSSYSVTIGAGGSGGTASGSGSDGGQSSFGTILAALGGKGGATNISNAPGTQPATQGAILVSYSTASQTLLTIASAGSTRNAYNDAGQYPNFYGPAAGGNAGPSSGGAVGGQAGGAGFGRTTSQGGGGAGGGTTVGAAGSSGTVIGDGGGAGSSVTTPGAGGDGYLGGGGGAGGYATTATNGGAGGGGYCLIISWIV